MRETQEWRMGGDRESRRRRRSGTGSSSLLPRTTSSSPLPRTREKRVEREVVITGRKGLASSVSSEAILSVRERRLAAVLPRKGQERVNKKIRRRVLNSWQGIQSPR